jgi:hypothetical protein
MLRHRHDQAAAWPKGLVHLGERAFVFVDVFEHIEGADDVELVAERQVSGVKPVKFGVGNALRSHR